MMTDYIDPAEFFRAEDAAANDPKPNGHGDKIDGLLPIDPSQLTDIPVPPREWLVCDWLPMARVAGLYGAGGEGKTTIVQQLATASAIKAPWLGLPVRPGRSVLMFCEDDLAEVQRRQEVINEHYGCTFAELGAVRWLPRLGNDNVLMTFDRGKALLTEIFAQLLAIAVDHKASLIGIDTLADVFAGNENDRGQARLFVQQALGHIARTTGAAVVALAHPSLSGINSGSGSSGNTGWVGTFRTHLYLSSPSIEEGEVPDDNARILSRKKTNVARRGETIELRWFGGVFIAKNAPTGILGSIERRTVEHAFCDLLDRVTEAGQHVSHNSRAGNYAPKIFSLRPDRDGFRKPDFERAMHSLLASKEIRVVEYKDAHRHSYACLASASNLTTESH